MKVSKELVVSHPGKPVSIDLSNNILPYNIGNLPGYAAFPVRLHQGIRVSGDPSVA